MIQQTSLSAFKDIIPELGKRQLEVLELFKKHSTLTDQQISRLLCLPINSVTPRRLELERKQHIENTGTIKSEYTGRKVRLYKLYI